MSIKKVEGSELTFECPWSLIILFIIESNWIVFFQAIFFSINLRKLKEIDLSKSGLKFQTLAVEEMFLPTNPAKLISVCKGRGTETPGHDAVLKDSQPLMSTREWAYAHSTLGQAWVSVESVSSSGIVTGKLRGHSKKCLIIWKNLCFQFCWNIFNGAHPGKSLIMIRARQVVAPVDTYLGLEWTSWALGALNCFIIQTFVSLPSRARVDSETSQVPCDGDPLQHGLRHWFDQFKIRPT